MLVSGLRETEFRELLDKDCNRPLYVQKFLNVDHLKSILRIQLKTTEETPQLSSVVPRVTFDKENRVIAIFTATLLVLTTLILGTNLSHEFKTLEMTPVASAFTDTQHQIQAERMNNINSIKRMKEKWQK